MSKKKTDRRTFIKSSVALGSFATLNKLGFSHVKNLSKDFTKQNGKYISIPLPENGFYYTPLEMITIQSAQKGKITVLDGMGNEYFTKPVNDKLSFSTGGHLGAHIIMLENSDGMIEDIATFRVDCKTTIRDENKEFNDIFKMLRFTMDDTHYHVAGTVRMNEKLYQYFSSWFQDHMYGMMGKKYFYPELKSGVDLYTDGQREDGMIHDNYKHPYDKNSMWKQRFKYGNFVTIPEDENSTCIYVRVPVENMAEFTYLETTYYTWKATGDDEWMKSKLDSMLKAVEYSTSDPYRWSEEYQLLKRGYTIDIWDFQSSYDTKRVGGDTMKVTLEDTYFNIMYGDNVRMAASCGFLAQMLNYAGRTEEAERIDKLGKGIKERIDKEAWNGKFYRHQIPLDEGVDRDFGGTDTSKQVTLSNTWALNRGVTHEQAVAIINTYQDIREKMPGSSPGEWYCCYPPFNKGWHINKWEYMNGGVTPIAAGELAHGAFEHGYEKYAVDILRRVYALAQKTGNKIHGCYKGKIMPEPERSFTPVTLKNIANADLSGKGAKGVPGWTNEGENDLHEMPVGSQAFHKIPFTVVDPAKNGRKACLILSGDKDYIRTAELPVNKKAGSIYFLHAMSSTGGDICAGSATLRYTDGTSYTKYMYSEKGKETGNWWHPSVPESRKGIPNIKVAWTGKNKVSDEVGVYVYGLNNPHPDKEIEKIEFEGQKNSTKWMILGITLSDAAVYFKPSIISTIPDHWAAAECMYALIEGLGGVKDTGVAFNKAQIAPRWDAAGVNDVKVTAKYEASGGYMSYQYRKTGNTLSISFTGSSNATDVKILLPAGKKTGKTTINGKETQVKTETIEDSTYACLQTNENKVYKINIQLI